MSYSSEYDLMDINEYSIMTSNDYDIYDNAEFSVDSTVDSVRQLNNYEDNRSKKSKTLRNLLYGIGTAALVSGSLYGAFALGRKLGNLEAEKKSYMRRNYYPDDIRTIDIDATVIE